jgi:hypothetical protein
MSKLLFFSRVAFICNICFVITFIIRYVPFLEEGFVLSTIVVTGLVLSIIINFIVNLFYCIMMAGYQTPIWKYIPKWLLITNFLFFVAQAILLII